MTVFKKREGEAEEGKKGEEVGTIALVPQKPSPHSTPSREETDDPKTHLPPFRGKTTTPQAQQ